MCRAGRRRSAGWVRDEDCVTSAAALPAGSHGAAQCTWGEAPEGQREGGHWPTVQRPCRKPTTVTTLNVPCSKCLGCCDNYVVALAPTSAASDSTTLALQRANLPFLPRSLDIPISMQRSRAFRGAERSANSRCPSDGPSARSVARPPPYRPRLSPSVLAAGRSAESD
jgi:hypothetical protein